MGNRKKLSVLTLVAIILLTGCAAAAKDADPNTQISESNWEIPRPGENSDHGYLLEDNRIPLIQTCAEWQKFWRFDGPAVSFEIADRFPNENLAVSTQIYLKNKTLDANGDGVICFNEDLEMRSDQVPPITPTSLLDETKRCRVQESGKVLPAGGVGFPIHPDYVLSDDRKIVVQLIYVDAPDQKADTKPSDDASFWIDGAGGYLRDVTDGQIDFEWRYEDTYFRLERKFSSFGITRTQQGNARNFIQAAIDASDVKVDFTDVDMVVVVPPPKISKKLIDYSPAIPLTKANGFDVDEGRVYRGTLAGADTRWKEGYLLIAHEIGHLLGLADYYSHKWRPGDEFFDQFRFMGEYDGMNNAAGRGREWTAWSRWLLGTLDESQVRCIDASSSPLTTTHQIWSISSHVFKEKMVVVRTGLSTAFVIESRKSQRNDKGITSNNEGLLVYKIDTKIKNGNGPLRIVRKKSLEDPMLVDAPLRFGEFVEVSGFKIENVGASDLWDIAKITKTSSD